MGQSFSVAFVHHIVLQRPALQVELIDTMVIPINNDTSDVPPAVQLVCLVLYR